METQKFSPRIEKSLSVMSNPAALQQILVETANCLLKGLRAHMAKEAKQAAFFKQLQILTPPRPPFILFCVIISMITRSCR